MSGLDPINCRSSSHCSPGCLSWHGAASPSECLSPAGHHSQHQSPQTGSVPPEKRVSGHVTCIDQWEVSIQVPWSVLPGPAPPPPWAWSLTASRCRPRTYIIIIIIIIIIVIIIIIYYSHLGHVTPAVLSFTPAPVSRHVAWTGADHLEILLILFIYF